MNPDRISHLLNHVPTTPFHHIMNMYLHKQYILYIICIWLVYVTLHCSTSFVMFPPLIIWIYLESWRQMSFGLASIKEFTFDQVQAAQNHAPDLLISSLATQSDSSWCFQVTESISHWKKLQPGSREFTCHGLGTKNITRNHRKSLWFQERFQENACLQLEASLCPAASPWNPAWHIMRHPWDRFPNDAPVAVVWHHARFPHRFRIGGLKQAADPSSSGNLTISRCISLMRKQSMGLLNSMLNIASWC